MTKKPKTSDDTGRYTRNTAERTNTFLSHAIPKLRHNARRSPTAATSVPSFARSCAELYKQKHLTVCSARSSASQLANWSRSATFFSFHDRVTARRANYRSSASSHSASPPGTSPARSHWDLKAPRCRRSAPPACGSAPRSCGPGSVSSPRPPP